MCDWERQQGEKRNDVLNMHREVSEKMHYKLLLTNDWTNYMYFAAFSAHYPFWTMVYSSLEEFSRL